MSNSDNSNIPNQESYAEQCRNLGIDEASIMARIQLSQSIGVHFEQNKLVNVLEYLCNTSGVEFFVNWSLLEAAGIEQDLSISLLLQRVTFDHVLEIVLGQASAPGLEPIGYVIRQGIVLVSTRRDLSKEKELRVYGVRHLVSPLNEDATMEELEHQLVTLISDIIGDQSDWACYGGEVSSAYIVNGNLAVKTTPEHQVAVAQFLSQLSQIDLIGRQASVAGSGDAVATNDVGGDQMQRVSEQRHPTKPISAERRKPESSTSPVVLVATSSGKNVANSHKDNTWQVVKVKAETIVANSGFPGVRPLARKIGCSVATMDKAIRNSVKLKAANATKKSRKARSVGLTDIVLDRAVQQTELDPYEMCGDDSETLDKLIAESEKDKRAEESRPARARRRKCSQ